jgi:nitroimidazol reductase NimA-like FMN-containing flavoprotein (pyridoxamine 5'-phosphate oxidase superfamily)
MSEHGGMSQPSTQITRIREKGSTDRHALDALLDATQIGHFGLIDPTSGAPVVIPTAVVRDGDRVLAHGSTGSGWMRQLASGAATCLAVTVDEGIVVARSAFESSLHYRSAVLFGSCSVLEPDEREHALDVITEGLIPGRVAELRRPVAAELAATLVLAMPIERWSLKISDGWPEDDERDVAGTAWAGVVPRIISFGTPHPAPDLRPGIEVPESVQSLRRARTDL